MVTIFSLHATPHTAYQKNCNYWRNNREESPKCMFRSSNRQTRWDVLAGETGKTTNNRQELLYKKSKNQWKKKGTPFDLQHTIYVAFVVFSWKMIIFWHLRGFIYLLVFSSSFIFGFVVCWCPLCFCPFMQHTHIQYYWMDQFVCVLRTYLVN